MASEAAAQVQLTNFESIFSLEGKVAVVTGGSRGLGLHVASGLLQAGASKVYISSRKAAACDEAVAALNALPNKRPGAQAISVPADGSKVAELDRLVAEVSKTTDHVDVLFANAGATWGAPFDEYPEQAFNKVMDLNVKGVFYTIQKYVLSLSLPANGLLTDIAIKIHATPGSKGYAGRPIPSHHHSIRRRHRRRNSRQKRLFCVFRVQSSGHQPDQDAGR
jgi:NAD(P)-dependent dehydrogenase (short-subunit alcohol dehydrogenase family)